MARVQQRQMKIGHKCLYPLSKRLISYMVMKTQRGNRSILKDFEGTDILSVRTRLEETRNRTAKNLEMALSFDVFVILYAEEDREIGIQ